MILYNGNIEAAVTIDISMHPQQQLNLYDEWNVSAVDRVAR